MPIEMSHPTTSHETIRRWARALEAMPAEILPGHVDGIPPELTFLMPGHTSRQVRLRVIGWDDFFANFEVHGLASSHEVRPDGSAGRSWELLQIESKSPARIVHEAAGEAGAMEETAKSGVRGSH